MFNLETKISELYRVGAATAKKLSSLGVDNVRDLLFYFPFRHDDFSSVKQIKDCLPGEQVTVLASVLSAQAKVTPYRHMRFTEAVFDDGTGKITAVWFNQPFLAKSLKVGEKIALAGTIVSNKYGVSLQNPVYERLDFGAINTSGLVPVYNLTAGLTQKQLRFLISIALKYLPLLEDWLPDFILKKNELLNLQQAINDLHYPKKGEDLVRAKKRLAFDEVFLTMLQGSLMKKQLEVTRAVPQELHKEKVKELVASLPFELTDDQRKAAMQILQDTGRELPMNRLIQGDVGSGKTVVAALAAFNTAQNGLQTAIMAPTEILAFQHYKTLIKVLKKSGLKVGLATNKYRLCQEKDCSVDDLNKLIEAGKIDIIVGTHALIAGGVVFKNLGLVVVDEQHRFGVEQRKSIKQKTRSQFVPHFLSMTATPIPRTLALLMYGDLDISIIRQMPKDRKPIQTKAVETSARQKTYEFIRNEIKNGRQVFVVCPLIDPSDKLGAKSVTDEYEKLNKEVFPDISIGLMHGRLKSSEKEKVMADFQANKTKILVSTSVIEVGIDVPNATVMMIEGSERFGLAQLHQFRGRVGRGAEQSYCFLFATKGASMKAQERLKIMEKATDGFTLAEYDLKERGAGEVFGTRQSGLAEMRFADLNDSTLITKAKEATEELLAEGGIEKYPALEVLIKDKLAKAHLE